jgi:hypothetical protein
MKTVYSLSDIDLYDMGLTADKPCRICRPRPCMCGYVERECRELKEEIVDTILNTLQTGG